MKVFVGERVKKGSLKFLKPTDRLFLAIKMKYENSESYRRRLEKEELIKAQERSERIERLKSIALVQIRDVFQSSDKKKIHLRINRQNEDIIDEVLSSKEFLPYKIVKKTENPDILKAFKNELPIIVEIQEEVVNIEK